jgi:CRISPR-associated endonuclease/helicase Cas3
MTNPKNQPIAHAAKDRDGSWREPHDLAEHLAGVASLAACFAREFGEDWARLAGQWHDLGKYRPAFQDYIRHASGFDIENAHIEGANRVDHSTAGAVHAISELGEGGGRLLAYLIAGHHAGLPDWNGTNASVSDLRRREKLVTWKKELNRPRPNPFFVVPCLQVAPKVAQRDSIFGCVCSSQALWTRTSSIPKTT